MTKGRIVKEIVFWIITLLLAIVCLRSGLMKMPGIPGVEFWVRDFARWGYPDWFKMVVGITELASFLLLLLPRLAGFGAFIFGIVMLGAIYTHATHGESGRLPFNFLLLTFSLIIMFARRRDVINNFFQTRSIPAAE
jgi:putative oxidoreductase